MLINVADKQVLTGPGNAISQFMSDAIELQQFNRAAAILVVHYYHGDLRFDYWTEVSNDLRNWTPEGPSDAFSIAVPPPRQRVGGVHGRFMRVGFMLGAGTAGTTGQMSFDLKVRLDVDSLDHA